MLARRINRGWKNLWFPVLDRLLRRRSRGCPANLTSVPRRVLFIRHDRIGDAIVSYPVLQALARLSPDVRIDVVCSPRNYELLRRYDLIDRLHLYERGRHLRLLRLAIRLRRRKFDVAIDPVLRERSLTTLLLVWASGSRSVLGFEDCGTYGITHPVPGNARADRVGELLARLLVPFGMDSREIDQTLRIPIEDGEYSWATESWKEASSPAPGPRVLVNVTGGDDCRDWRDERFVAVIETIRSRMPAATVCVVGAPFARERVSRIAVQAGAVAVFTPALGMLIGLVATADFVFTPDTSVVHMATAFHIPTVAMYLKGIARQWGVPAELGISVESPTETLDDLALEDVLPAVESVLETVLARAVVIQDGSALSPLPRM